MMEWLAKSVVELGLQILRAPKGNQVPLLKKGGGKCFKIAKHHFNGLRQIYGFLRDAVVLLRRLHTQHRLLEEQQTHIQWTPQLVSGPIQHTEIEVAA